MAREKKAKPSVALQNVRKYRKNLGLNQAEFWSIFGATQSGGSRYETGRDMPESLSMLFALVESQKVTLDDLVEARRVVAATFRG